jgi:chromate transporter
MLDRTVTPLGDVVRLFLKLGTIAFGGPAAHIAMMEDEVVRRRQWLTRDQFLDYVSAANLIPGPNSTELAIHIGYRRAGWLGLIAAGVSFILPAALIVSGLAAVYVRSGSLPALQGILYGVKPVVIAVIAQAIWVLGRTAVKTLTLGVVALAAVAATAVGVHELVVLAFSGVAVLLADKFGSARKTRLAVVLAGLFSASSGSAAVNATAAAPFALWTLFLVFVKAGAVLFGSGYVLVAFIRADLTERLGWLTESQLLDAIAVGQVTPGPVFTTATFVGYLLGGGAGALVATLGIFLPAFVFVAVSGPLVPRLRASAVAAAILDGVNVASLALMVVASSHIAHTALIDVTTVVLAVSSLVLLVRWRVNSAWLIALGAVVGFLAYR